MVNENSFAKENTDYWVVVFRNDTVGEFGNDWTIDTVKKLPLPTAKDMFAKTLASDDGVVESTELNDIYQALNVMTMRVRFNSSTMRGPYVFMADAGLFEDEDDFHNSFEEGDKLTFMKMISEKAENLTEGYRAFI